MAKDTKAPPSCAECGLELGDRICYSEDGKGAKGCPTLTKTGLRAEADAELQQPENREFARQSSIQEADCYANRGVEPYIMQPTKPRVVELCEFAHKMGYKKLGLAFCMGLRKEAGIVHEIFTSHGLETISAICKAGRSPKSEIDLTAEETINFSDQETMCHPIFQAKLLNQAGADLNVLLGLCVGHDSLFIKYAEAPVTVLAVKDRATGHNPLAAIYLHESYFRKVKYPDLC